ncbi:helix-turn-helix transcriptional regulator [Solitalea sp. MAHUQ-68]|uniref:Helix-turn-helix transcriptional regulator n=1 Tax=Solitalea agri TaxID=2953739 RepID=A0A9X2JDU1_9SPHI|nr:response regulator transcription factor [Solitalea agri]MCO4293290.1 helix-turn-helix transcriptional regulator [Solitalea agri]
MNVLAAGVLIAGIIQGLILIILLLKKETNHLPNRLLAFFILLVVVHLSLIVIELDNNFLKAPHLSKLTWLLPVLYGPMIIVITQSIVSINFRFSKKHLLLLLPFLIYLCVLLPYYLKSAAEKMAYLSNVSGVLQDDFGFINQFTNLMHVSFLLIALVIFYRNKRALIGFYSDPGRVNLQWLKQFLVAMLSIIFISISTFYLKKYEVKHVPEIYPYHFLLAVALIYWIGFRLLQDPTLLTTEELRELETVSTTPEIPFAQASETTVKYQKSGFEESDQKLLAETLIHYMKEQQPYLNSNLTINDLCETLFVKRHQLSQTINAEFGKNFFELINEYRIDEFKKQIELKANNQFSILGIALNCGFNSKATFNMAFKKSQGITPSEYIKKTESEIIYQPESKASL